MEVTGTLRGHGTPIRMTKIKHLIILNASIMWNKWNSYVWLIGMHDFAATLENHLEGFSPKVIHMLTVCLLRGLSGVQ